MTEPQPNRDSKALASYLQKTGKALAEDARANDEIWSLGQGDDSEPDRTYLHLRGDYLFDRSQLDYSAFEQADASGFARISYEERLETAEHLIAGTAAGLLTERLHALHGLAAAASGAARCRKAEEKLKTHRSRAVAVLTRCLEEPALSDANQAFEQAVNRVPKDIEIYKFIPDELAESYWDGLLKVVSEYVPALQGYLASLNTYAEQLVAHAATRRHVYLNDTRKQLSQRLKIIIGELDGQRLHQSKETLRRVLESSARSDVAKKDQEGGHRLSDTFIGRLVSRKADPEPGADSGTPQAENTNLRHKRGELEETFESISRDKQEVKTKRDEILAQMQLIDREFKDAGIDPTEINFGEGEPEPEILNTRKTLREKTERLRRTAAPLERLLDALDDQTRSLDCARSLAQFGNLVRATVPSRTFMTCNAVTSRLLQVYWMHPIRFLDICLKEAATGKEEVFDSKNKRLRTLADWLACCLSEAARVDHSLEYFVSEIRHAAPEPLADAFSAECELMFSVAAKAGMEIQEIQH